LFSEYIIYWENLIVLGKTKRSMVFNSCHKNKSLKLEQKEVMATRKITKKQTQLFNYQPTHIGGE